MLCGRTAGRCRGSERFAVGGRLWQAVKLKERVDVCLGSNILFAAHTLQRECAPLRRAKLVPAMVPAALVALGALPLLPSGKVDMRALPLPPELGRGAAATARYDPPEDQAEARLQRLWAQVLQLDEPPSMAADFFSLGGNSMQARLSRF